MKKFYLYITLEERKLVIESLISMKNVLISEGEYTDGVDEVLLRMMKSKRKKVRVKYA